MVQKTIYHFSHPHPLFEISDNVEFLCNGCKIPGTGTWYRCNACNFDLHGFCCTCPATFSSLVHPQHQLTLVVRKSDGTRQNKRVCDLCRDEVEGLFYRCNVCDFDIHPLCTQLPEFLRHPVHPIHPLRLQEASSPTWCVFCHDLCTCWRYRCGICGVDMHIECVMSSLSSDIPPPVSPPPPQPPFNGGGAYAAPPCYQNQCPNLGQQYHQLPNHQYQNINQGQGGGSNGKHKIGKRIGIFVGKLALGVLSTSLGAGGFSFF